MDEQALQAEVKAVPKFASFKPKHATQPSISDSLHAAHPDEAVNRAGKEEGAGGSRHGRREDGHRTTHPRRHRPRREHEAHIETLGNGRPELIIAAWDNSEPSFVLDVKGDPGNLTYGSIHRYVVPSHHRFGAGSVIGLAPNNKIDRYTRNEQIVRTSTNQHDQSRKRDKTSFAKAERKGVRTLRVKPDSPSSPLFDANADFLPLNQATTRKQKRKDSEQSSDSSSSSSHAMNRYKSIERKVKRSDRPDDRDLAYVSDSSGTELEDSRSIALDEVVRNRSIVLSRRVDTDPTNADAWLDLINHQDALIGLGQNSLRSKITNAERTSTGEVKLSIYERALESIKSPLERERMILGMMEEGAKVWETKKTFSKWRDVLEADPSYFALWQKYLDFRQADFSTFRYEGARKVYSECLSMLKKARSNQSAKTSSCGTFYELQLYVMLRMTLFMREAGYSEHATGIWQALLEHTFCRPSHSETLEGPNLSPEAVRASLSSFRDFWESEVPRIGEDRAMGWSTYVSKGGDAPQSKTVTTGQAIGEDRVFETWSTCEHKRARSSRWPARTIDDVEEDDPYRVILFSDVQDFLELVDPPSPAELEVTLAAFLAFCHLPSLSASDGNQSCVNMWWRDSYIRNDNLHSSEAFFPRRNTDNQNQRVRSILLQDRSSQSSGAGDIFKCPLPFFTPSVGTLFATESWFSAFSGWENCGVIDPGPLDPDWVRGVLRMLVNIGIGGDSLAEYYLAFELTNYSTEARKIAKSLLKQRSSSLRLYNAYALIEYRLHNSGNAQKVIITAINMSKGLDHVAQRDTILLWQTWTWELLDSGRTQEALQRLLTLPDGTIVEGVIATSDDSSGTNGIAGAAALLRARRVLSDGRDQMLSSRSTFHAVLYAECLVLLTYLSENLSITAALSSFQSNLAILSSTHLKNPSVLETFHQWRARLLYHHTTHTHSFKPSILRDALAESVRLFPTNTIFLSLYAWNESRFRIDDRVRSIIADVLHDSQDDSIITWFFSLQNEMRRGVVLGSNMHAIRGTFERAVASRTGRCSALLWKQYVVWEQGQGEVKRANGVFWRAVRASPWVKEIYMLAFGCLRGGMRLEELRGVYELMGEKELRVHVSLDEVFEAWDERRAKRLEKDGERALEGGMSGDGDD